MPELPEVEVSRLGIAPWLVDQRVDHLIVRERRLRWPIPHDIEQALGETIVAVRRRAKYLLIDTAPGSIVLHLGMSGKLRVIDADTPPVKHDHLDIVLGSGRCLRLNDPRRFGACLWQRPEETLSQLANLGPEPLTDAFDGEHLFQKSRSRQMPVKSFIMDNPVVVGVGNIYASEALFMAGIDPRRAAGRVSRKRYVLLAECIKAVLAKAIEQGGTTLKDFTQSDGKPGYFAQQLTVYGRAGEPCMRCEGTVKSKVIGQRNTYFCTACQR
ncbi:bifunctional DNA-formamidopyrimidine glycosylase/DNA-(apurinic or apyrimidinic site) lyase [Alteromonas halophila]|uniref:Formamidopyrimidine-DNA glycosylase n=1 Tax=Alteromonas halophila TaxID=516698 RepID=A0A918JKH9_9ALTE|nr:bifunctional DNA-formamidopyrimidine glycosylase/DNA-(apurinic or apyrimidinic site) lyase [Alteromonas halophila]GGW85166.1 formamidopyrimidine-DNA glycosylase [Alteromonas halophila]